MGARCEHHLRFRSAGGDNGRSNRITVGAAHRLHGIHAGVVRAFGAAPGNVRWELGVRRDGPPLLRDVGDGLVGGPPQRRPINVEIRNRLDIQLLAI